MLLKVATTETDGQSVNHPGVVTVTRLHARGRLFFTYVNGGENDLERSRQTAKSWAAAIVDANPSDETTRAKESAPGHSFAWSRAWRGAIIGGIISGRIALFRRLGKHRDYGGSSTDG